MSQSEQSPNNLEELTHPSDDPSVPPQKVEQEEGYNNEASKSQANDKKTLPLIVEFFKLPENIGAKNSSMSTIDFEELVDKFGISEHKHQAI